MNARIMVFHQFLMFVFLSGALCGSHAQVPQTNNSAQLSESRDLNAKVVKLYGEHKYNEALPLARRAIELAEQALGKTDARLIPLWINLGDLYIPLLRIDEAKVSFERALAIGETNFGNDDLRLTTSLDKIAFMARGKSDFKKAADISSRSLAIKEKFLKPGDVEIARATYILADTYRLTRDVTKAEQLFQESIRLYDLLGRKDREFVEVLRKYLLLLTSEGKRNDAALIQSRLAELSAAKDVVEGGIVNRQAIKLVPPLYPAFALSAHADGKVEVRVLIDETGKVLSASAISGHPLLQGAAVEAAKASKFTPSFKEGLPVKVLGIVIYNFVAQ
jgi:TonB family protein